MLKLEQAKRHIDLGKMTNSKDQIKIIKRISGSIMFGISSEDFNTHAEANKASSFLAKGINSAKNKSCFSLNASNMKLAQLASKQAL